MENIRLIRTRNDIKNGWVVKADTKRFGKDEIMFEGSYDECFKYLDRQFQNPNVEKYKVSITGVCDEGWTIFDNDWLIVHRNGFVEQDWKKLGF